MAAAAPPPSAPEADPWLLHTKDGRFTLKIGAQIQMRYVRSDADKRSERNGFKMQEVRPQLRATLGKPWISVFVQPELANVPQLLDLELTLRPHPSFGFKVGQVLTPFSQTFYTPVPKLLFQAFSEANAFFRADRETGAMLFGAPLHGVLEYYAAAFNGNRINQNGNDDDKLLFIGRVAVNPLGTIAYDETPALAGPQPFRFGVGVNGDGGRVPHVPPSAPAFPRPPTDPALEADPPNPRAYGQRGRARVRRNCPQGPRSLWLLLPLRVGEHRHSGLAGVHRRGLARARGVGAAPLADAGAPILRPSTKPRSRACATRGFARGWAPWPCNTYYRSAERDTFARAPCSNI